MGAQEPMTKKKRKQEQPQEQEQPQLATLGAVRADLIPARPAAGTAATPQSVTALPAVWAAVDLIAATVLQIPLRSLVDGELVPVPEWLRKPERWNDGAADQATLLESLTAGQALHGAGYLWAQPMGAQAWRLQPIDPARVTVTLEQAKATRARRRTYRLDGELVPTARRYTTRASQAGLIPVPHRTLPGIPAGVGPIQAAQLSIGAYLDAETYGSEVFGDGVPAGILKSEQELSERTATRYRDDWMANSSSPVRVLGSGLDFHALKLDPKSAAWLDARRFNGEEIARMFLIPAHKLNLSVSSGLTYSNSESLERDFLRGCIQGYLTPIERALNALLPPGRTRAEEQTVDFDYRALMRSTTAERYASYATALASGWLTVDEVRELEGLQPLPASAQRPDSGSPASRIPDTEQQPEEQEEDSDQE